MPLIKRDPCTTCGPDNAEHELRKAYYHVMGCLSIAPHRPGPESSDLREQLEEVYRHAYQLYLQGNRLAAERWARAAKHLAQALEHEFRISFVEKNPGLLPYLPGAQNEEYGLYQRSDTTMDLLNSIETYLPMRQRGLPPPQLESLYLDRAREHLKKTQDHSETHELLRAERLQTAHEYGRALECIILGFEAEGIEKTQAA